MVELAEDAFVVVPTGRHPATADVWAWLEEQTYMDAAHQESICRKLIELDISLHVLDLTQQRERGA